MSRPLTRSLERLGTYLAQINCYEFARYLFIMAMAARHSFAKSAFSHTAALISVFLAGAICAGDDSPPTQPVHAFSVAKEINQSYVSYDAKLTGDCSFDQKDPLELYWMTPLGKGHFRRDDLNFIENKLYGMDVQKAEPHLVVGEVKALQHHDVKLTVRITSYKKGQRCLVRTTVQGPSIPNELVIQSLFLKNYSGSTPKQIVVSGVDNKTQQKKSYDLNVG